MSVDELTEAILKAATEVHRILGPGLLESSYINCWCRELHRRGIPFETNVSLPVGADGMTGECGCTIDILVDKRVVLAMKTGENMDRIYEAQLLTYLRVGGWNEGLLLNFNIPVLADGVKRWAQNVNIEL